MENQQEYSESLYAQAIVLNEIQAKYKLSKLNQNRVVGLYSTISLEALEKIARTLRETQSIGELPRRAKYPTIKKRPITYGMGNGSTSYHSRVIRYNQ